jgi:hypothetical protein
MPLKETGYLTDDSSVTVFGGMATTIGNYLSAARRRPSGTAAIYSRR